MTKKQMVIVIHTRLSMLKMLIPKLVSRLFVLAVNFKHILWLDQNTNDVLANENLNFIEAKEHIQVKIDKHLQEVEALIEKQMQKWRTIKEKRAQEEHLHSEIQS